MGTTVGTFYPAVGLDQDFTAPGEKNIRGMADSVQSSNNLTVATFSTAEEEIVLDPGASRSLTGTADYPNYGWAIQRSGGLGMDSTATAKRYIPLGSWTFNARIGVPSVSIANVRMRIRVYRVSSTGERTEFSSQISALVTPTIAGTDITLTTTPIGEVLLEADETILVSYSLQKTNSGLGTNGGVQFRTNDLAGLDAEVILPGPIRTRYYRGPFSGVATGVVSWIRAYRFIRATDAPAIGVASFSRTLTLYRAFAVSSAGLTVMVRKVGKPFTVAVGAGVATVTKKVGKPLSTTATGVATVVKKVGKRLITSTTGVATFTRSLTLYRTFSEAAVGVASFVRKLTLRRTLAASATGLSYIWAKLPIGKIPYSTGGPSVIKKVTQYIFDD
jgi:hypothetical protein